MSATFRSPSGLHGFPQLSLKRLVTWGDHHKVGQPQLDAQHEAIFGIALEIADNWYNHRRDLEQLKAAAEKLNKVLESHFRFEEQQLGDSRYGKLGEHRAEHNVMLDELRRIRGWLERLDPRTIQTESGSLLLNYLLGVTVGHISHSDLGYCGHALNAAGAPEV